MKLPWSKLIVKQSNIHQEEKNVPSVTDARMSKITISVCIPTMNRYYKFLQHSIQKYIENEHINEIIVCDETGEDYQKIKDNFNNDKLKVFKNDMKLGCFKNKMNVASKATCEYICILDSDNYADENYFISFKKFILENNFLLNSVYLPSFARPSFDYRSFSDKEITKYNVKELLNNSYRDENKGTRLDILLNTMNCIIPKEFFDKYDILNDNPWCDTCLAFDSEYFSLYSLYVMNANIYCVTGMEYEHRIHNENHYTLMVEITGDFQKRLHSRFFELT